MTTAILVVVLLYVGASLVLGLISQQRSAATSAEYFLTGRSLPWFSLGLTFVATWYSTFAFIGAPGFYYEKGVTWLLNQGAFTLGSLPLMWFIGRKLWLLGRANGYVTPADLLADFYDSHVTRVITAAISIFALVPYSLIQLIAIGKTLERATDGTLPYTAGVLLAVGAAAFYVFTGGVRAIVWTDVFQGLLFTTIIVAGAAVSVWVAGGLGAGFDAALAEKPTAFTLDPANFGSSFTTIVTWSFGFVLLPHLWQRAYMARSGGSFAGSVVAQGVLGCIVVVFLMITGMLSIGFMDGVEDPDKLMSALFYEHLPPFVPLLVLATFAAGMSTIDSQLLTVSSVCVRDLAEPWVRGGLTSRQERFWGRVGVVGVLLLIAVLALTPGAQGPIIVIASQGISFVFLLLVPLLGALFWSAGRAEINLGLILAIAVFLLFELELLPFGIPFGFGPAIAACLLQLLLVGAASAWRRRPAA